MVVLAHLQRRWSLRGREGCRILSPSLQACEAGFNISLWKWNAYFPLWQRWCWRQVKLQTEKYSSDTESAASDARPTCDTVLAELRVFPWSSVRPMHVAFLRVSQSVCVRRWGVSDGTLSDISDREKLNLGASELRPLEALASGELCRCVRCSLNRGQAELSDHWRSMTHI